MDFKKELQENYFSNEYSEKEESHLKGFTQDEKHMIKLMAGILVKYIINSRENLHESEGTYRSRTGMSYESNRCEKKKSRV